MDTSSGDLPRPDKRPSTVLAGTYGHPIHPVLVTVPIGAWVASLVFDVASRVGADPAVFAPASRWLIALGVLGGLAAGLVGAIDYFGIPAGTRAQRIALLHLSINLVVIAAYAVNFALLRGTPTVSNAALALSVVSLAGLGFSGWLGGQLSFRYGVRVAAESDQSDGFVGPQSRHSH